MDKCDDYLELIKKVVKAFEENNIKYCHWKSNQHLHESFLGQTDLDILVDEKQKKLTREILSNMGLKLFKSERWKSYPDIEDWLGMDQKDGTFFHIHLHFKLLTGKKGVKEQLLPWESYILKNTIKEEKFNIFVTDPNIEMVLLFLRIGVKTKYKELYLSKTQIVPNNIINEINYLKERIDKTHLKNHINNMLGDEGSKLIDFIYSKNINDTKTLYRLKRYVHSLINKYRRINEMQIIYKQLDNFSKRAIFKVYRKLGGIVQAGKQSNNGKVITVIGVDGAGKSTVSKEIFKWLRGKIDVHKLYLGSGDGKVGIMTGVKQKVTSKSTDSSKSKNNHDLSKNSIIKDIIGPFFRVGLSRERLNKIKKASKGAERGSLIITDRFPQNQFYGIYDGPSILKTENNSIIRKMYSVFENRNYEKINNYPPNIVIKLSISAEKAFDRKPDHNFEKMKQKVAITEKLEFENSIVKVIDATEPLDAVLLKIKIIIWENL